MGQRRDSQQPNIEADRSGPLRLPPAGRRLGRVHLVKQLPKRIQECVVVLGAEDLGHKGAAGGQELGGQAEGLQDEDRLRVGLGRPRAADLGVGGVGVGVGGGGEGFAFGGGGCYLCAIPSSMLGLKPPRRRQQPSRKPKRPSRKRPPPAAPPPSRLARRR
jgi:hypothetical protein